MLCTFIWYELLTSDPDAAARFYGAVMGWQSADSGQAGMDYRFLSKDGVAVGGLMALPPGAAEAGMRPGWLGYVSVADVDRAVGSFIATGGALHMPAMDVPGIGRMAMVADPQGAALYVMTPIGTDAATSFAPGKPGHGGWRDCMRATGRRRWRSTTGSSAGVKPAGWTWDRSALPAIQLR